jgi:hypothetical protein
VKSSAFQACPGNKPAISIAEGLCPKASQ